MLGEKRKTVLDFSFKGKFGFTDFTFSKHQAIYDGDDNDEDFLGIHFK